MLNKEDILALAWEHSEGSGKRYTFTEESLFEFLKELKKGPATAQDEREVMWDAGADLDQINATRPAQTEQQPVRLPERKPDFPSSDATGEDWENSGWNAALDEVTRLNVGFIAQTAQQTNKI